ncbi:hypothetical protein Asppvi_011365 [Aspergillus pseudoviridinutans]|uniref:Uncharacterized protein n=1 Tax=Aspergillus pseudoviridinutans TaxID=1517512 RepID=A0A9P3BP18_9EURO|nr:uncharacterized protein Asppvi_011365 [Aspergillus pseudoviridinutans]GIJ92383.1 hypothetical protein Asppvi_011365 [Aspergillus pseudoviridinutans]
MPAQKVPTRFKHARAKFFVLKDDGKRRIKSWHLSYPSVCAVRPVCGGFFVGHGAATDPWELYRVLKRFFQCGPEVGRLLTLIRETGFDYRMHPDYLVSVLHELLGSLLFYRDGRMIYERVGAVRLLLDEKRVHEWNLDERLEGMHCKEEEDAKWRSFALAHRSQMGLRHLTTRQEEALV